MGLNKTLLAVVSAVIATSSISIANASDGINMEAGLGGQCMIFDINSAAGLGDTMCGVSGTATAFFDLTDDGSFLLGVGVDGFYSLSSADGSAGGIDSKWDGNYIGGHVKARIPLSEALSLELHTGYYSFNSEIELSTGGASATEDMDGSMWLVGAGINWMMDDAWVLNLGYRYGTADVTLVGISGEIDTSVIDANISVKF